MAQFQHEECPVSMRKIFMEFRRWAHLHVNASPRHSSMTFASRDEIGLIVTSIVIEFLLMIEMIDGFS